MSRYRCPDLTPALLCKDNGRRLWHIIRTIAESAVRFPLSDNYISIVSEVWDVLHEVERIDGYPKFRGSPAQKHCQVLCEHREFSVSCSFLALCSIHELIDATRAGRNYFIALFVACLCSAMASRVSLPFAAFLTESSLKRLPTEYRLRTSSSESIAQKRSPQDDQGELDPS